MSLGRVQQGDWLTVPLWTEDSSGAVAFPTDNTGAVVWPFLSVIDATQTHQKLVLADQPMNAVSRFDTRLTGLHQLELRIGPELPVGTYHIWMEWQAGSATSNRMRLESFQVVAGGHPAGAYTSIHFYHRPQAVFIVGFTDGGRLEARRNPTL